MTRRCEPGFLAAGAALLIAIATAPAAAVKLELQRACFKPEELLAKPGEERARRMQTPVKSEAEPELADQPQSVAPETRGVIRGVQLENGEKIIALTFDLCEQAGAISGYDGRIVDILRRERVKATFFAGGKWMQTHAERAEQLISDPLFEIANHSQTHRNLRLLDGSARLEEIVGPQRVYARLRAKLASSQCAAGDAARGAAIEPRMRLFRFPYGACNPAAIDAVNDAGMLAIQWDLSTGDPDPRVSAAAITRAIVSEAKPGAIIISHANGHGWHTAEGLTSAIRKLKAKGYGFATVSELLARGKPVVVARCYDVRPGDTDRYDNLAALKRRQPGVAGRKVRLARLADGPARSTSPRPVSKSKRARIGTAKVRPSTAGKG